MGPRARRSVVKIEGHTALLRGPVCILQDSAQAGSSKEKGKPSTVYTYNKGTNMEYTVTGEKLTSSERFNEALVASGRLTAMSVVGTMVS